MQTGYRGTYVIPWAQVVIDGERAPAMDMVRPGGGWLWTGQPTRVDGPTDVLVLDNPLSGEELQQRARRKVRRMFGNVMQVKDPLIAETGLFKSYFTVTDGRLEWRVTLISTGEGRNPLVLFEGALPPQETVLWIVKDHVQASVRNAPLETPGGVICFTPGTMIATPDGPRDVLSLQEGDHVQTQDNGAAEILWIGRRVITGARMKVLPHLRPVRLLKGSLDQDVPDTGLLVSPDHRVVLRGARAQSLFGTDEVLVTARDLINDDTVLVDYVIPNVVYIHMMLAQHEIVFANGVATETFHPASAALASLRPEEQTRLLTRVPEINGNPMAYGGYARRRLSPSDAAVLQADMGQPSRY